jgi:hypothetical protein
MSPKAVPVYVWTIEGVAVCAEIATAVLAELRLTLDSQPRDAEFGGILLGRSITEGENFRTQVTSFEPLEIEHRYGERFTLSLRDRQSLERRVQRLRRKGLTPVGFYRSHERRGLYLDQKDFDVFKSEFRHPGSIFLLLGQEAGKPAKGAVFVWEDDDVRRHASYLEFPLPQVAVAGMPAAVRPAAARVPQKRTEGVAERLAAWRSKLELPKVPAVSLPKFALPNWTLSNGAAKVALTIALPLLCFYGARQLAANRVNVAAAAETQVVSKAEQQPPVLTAQATSPEVSAAPVPVPVEAPAATKESPFAEPVAPAKVAPVRSGIESRDRVLAPPPRVMVSVPRPITKAELATPAIPEPPIVQPAALSLSVPKIVSSPLNPVHKDSNRVLAFVKPVQPSSLRQAIGKVPLLRGFSGRNSNEDFVPANPIEVPVPTQASAGNAVKKGNTIEMLAKVDRQGNVESVKLVDGNRQLADTSAEAILRWRFEPARQNGAPVDSSMRIRFEFPNK